MAGGFLAWLTGLVLGEYPFSGDGIQWLAIFGGLGVGLVMAWVINRIWGGAAPMWMVPVTALFAVLGETSAVTRDADGAKWTEEGYIAIVAAAVAAGYGIWSAIRQHAAK